MADPGLQKGGPNNAYKRLYDLGDERMAVIEGRLARNDPAHMIADMVKDEWGEFADVPKTTLVRQLNRYRNQHIVPKLALEHSAKKAQGSALAKAYETFTGQLDTLAEIRDLIHVQKTRLHKQLNYENQSPMPLAEARAEIRELGNLLKMYADIQLETGLLRRAPKLTQGVMVNPDGTQSAFQYVVSEVDAGKLSDLADDLIRVIDSEFDSDNIPIAGFDPASEGSVAGAQPKVLGPPSEVAGDI